MPQVKDRKEEIQEITKKIDSITGLIEGLLHFNESMAYVRQSFFILMRSDDDIKQAIIDSLKNEKERLFERLEQI